MKEYNYYKTMENRKTHIVFCLGNIDKPGGIERGVTNRTKYLAEKAGYNVTIIFEHQGDLPFYYEISPKVNIIDLRANDITHPLLKIPIVGFFLKINLVKRLYQKVVNDIKPDIIINIERGFADFVIPSLRPRIPCVRGSHSSLRAVQLMNKSKKYKIKEQFFTFLYNRQLQKYDEVVFLTKEDMEYRNYKNGRNVIPNYIAKFEIEPNYNTESKRVISIGRLDKFKNFKDQIIIWKEVVKEHPGWTLHIFGEGPEKENLDNLINKLGLRGHVFIEGKTKKVAFELRKCAFFLFTSLAEGLGNVLIEAMQMGLPVVSYDCPSGPRDIISNGKDGFLIKVGDLVDLKSKVLYLINNPKERLEMSETAILKSKNYSEEVIMPQWISLFNKLQSDKNS